MTQTVETDILAPFEIWEVPFGDSTIRFFEPLVVTPTVLDKDTSAECFCAEYPELDLSAVGISLEELNSCVRSDIRMTWRRIVRKGNNELTPKEQAVKRRFLEMAEEVNDG